MRRFSAIGLACFSIAAAGLAGGCGDNLAASAFAGSGGAAGVGAGGKGGAGGTAVGGRGGSGTGGQAGGAGRGGGAGAAGNPAGGRSGSGGAGAAGGEGPGGIGGAAGGTAGGAGGGTAGSGGGGGIGVTGPKPVITFVTPTATSKLCGAANSANGCIADADGTSPGWQGTITVKVTLDGAPMTTGNANLSIGGLAFVNKALDGTGSATFASSTLPEGAAVALVAQTDDIPGRGVGMASLNLLVDTIPPSAQISQLTTSIVDRRKTTIRLSWTAPADGAAAIGGYIIRQSTSAIAADASFDTATNVPFTATPKAAGMAEQVDVTDLYIQKPYFFAIRATDAVGNGGPITIASAPATATFNQTILTPPAGGPTNEAFGYSVDAADDVFLSMTPATRATHLLVGNDGTRKQVYLYGGNQFNPASPADSPPPSTTFIGTTNYFGLDVCFTGDLDGDGRSEVAIAAPQDGAGKVFIFKGRDVWPVTLNENTADWTIVGSANYSAGGPGMGYALARTGDFNGDGKNDFAIGTWSYGGAGIGRVDIILGGTLPSPPATISLAGDAPAAPPVQVLTIDGDPSFSGGSFGDSLTSVANGTDTVLIVGASYAGGATATPKGRVYAYHRRTLAGGSRLTFAAADAFVEGIAAGAQLGETIANPGWVTPAMPTVVLSSPYTTLASPASNGFVQIMGGTPSNPFATTVSTIGDSRATNKFDLFGLVAIGGGFSGQTRTMSILKSTVPDLLVAATKEGNSTANLYIFDGAVLSGLPSPIDAAVSATVTLPLPSGWVASSFRSRGLPDLNGDGYQDFAIGENVPNGRGRVIVFW